MIVPETLLVWTLIGQLIIVLILGGGIVAFFLWTKFRQQKSKSLRKELQSELFERLFSSDPNWKTWENDLSRSERRELQTLLNDSLRKIEGEDYDRLRELASVLGIPERARRNLNNPGRRYRALTWLALLGESVEPHKVINACKENPKLRDAGARILLRSGHPDGPEKGTQLLVDNGTQPLTTMGMDTLYRLNNGVETPLLSDLEKGEIRNWNHSFLVQILLVLMNCMLSRALERPNWLFDLLEHKSSQVRLATVGVLQNLGWQEEIRRKIDIEQLIHDPDQNIRRKSYFLLASWGNETSLEWLRNTLDHEEPGDRFSIVKAFHLHPEGNLSELPDPFSNFVDWVRAERKVDSSRRIWEMSKTWV